MPVLFMLECHTAAYRCELVGAVPSVLSLLKSLELPGSPSLPPIRRVRLQG